MRIAVNTRFLLSGKLEGLGWYTHELLRRMVAAHPEDEFFLFFDRPYQPEFVYGKNVVPMVLSPKARHPLAWLCWFEYAVPLALRRCKADVFFSPDAYLSLRTHTPTVMTVHDLIPLEDPRQVRWWARDFYRWFIPRYLRRAEQLIAVSSYTRQQVITRTGIAPEKINVVYNGSREGFQSLSDIEKQHIRAQFAGGCLYFFYTGAIHPRKNISRLIRAFDQFKSRTQTPVKLLLAGRFAWQTGEVTASFEQAHFRHDIEFLGYIPDKQLAQLMAASLALVYVSLNEGFGLPVLEALHCDIPVICSNTSSLPEVAGDAALLVDPFSETDIAEALEKVLNDENLRAGLIKKGRLQRQKFDWDEAAEQVYALLKAASRS